jgi:hypothetical protein
MSFICFNSVVSFSWLFNNNRKGVRMSKRKTVRKNLSPMLIPPAVDVDLIRQEKNLLTLGLFAATSEKQTLRRIEREELRDGHTVRTVSEFRASPEYGLPTTYDCDKMMALMKIADEDRDERGQVVNPITFSGYQFIKVLDQERNADRYDDINRWGQRMTDVTIMSKDTVFLASKKKFSTDTFHVFTRFKGSGISNLDGTNPQQQRFEVELAQWLIDNMNQRFVVLQDHEAYKKLSRPISKGLYGFVHITFAASGGRPIEKDYLHLCNELGTKAYPHLSRIKQTMGPSFDELVSIGYLSKWDVLPMITKKGYKVRLEIGSVLAEFLRRHSSSRKALPDKVIDDRVIDAAQQEAIQSLLDHGVVPDRARELVQTYGCERVIDVVDFQSNQAKTNTKIQNLAGLIIFSLTNNLPIPVSYTSIRLRKEAQTKAQAADQRRQRDAEVRIAYEEAKEAALDKAFTQRFSPSQLQAHILATVASRGGDDLFKRVTADQKQVLAMQLIKKEVRDELEFPEFEEWSDSQSQGNLFLTPGTSEGRRANAM